MYLLTVFGLLSIEIQQIKECFLKLKNRPKRTIEFKCYNLFLIISVDEKEKARFNISFIYELFFIRYGY